MNIFWKRAEQAATALAIGMGSMLAAVPASAGTQVVGVELGVSTRDQVRKTVSGHASVEDAGTNRYSGGPMLKTDGEGYGIDGLQEVVYIFDQQDKLAAVSMTISKDRFDALTSVLAKKYRLTNKVRPFVGDMSANYAIPDGVIRVDAPHLSFSMEIQYLRSDLFKQHAEQSKSASEQRRRSEAQKF